MNIKIYLLKDHIHKYLSIEHQIDIESPKLPFLVYKLVLVRNIYLYRRISLFLTIETIPGRCLNIISRYFLFTYSICNGSLSKQT